MNGKSDAHIVAMEWLKHLITLSSSIIVFSGAFFGGIVDEPNWSLSLLGFSWILLLASIMLSLDTLSAITYSRINDDVNWTEGRGKKTARASKWCFAAGITVFAIFAGINIAALVINAQEATQAALVRMAV